MRNIFSILLMVMICPASYGQKNTGAIKGKVITADDTAFNLLAAINYSPVCFIHQWQIHFSHYRFIKF